MVLMDQQPGQQVGINIDLMRVVGEKQVRLEAAVAYAQQLEQENAKLKAAVDDYAQQVEALHAKLTLKSDDLRQSLDIIDDLKKETHQQ